jgi:hypothetical protein
MNLTVIKYCPSLIILFFGPSVFIDRKGYVAYAAYAAAISLCTTKQVVLQVHNVH